MQLELEVNQGSGAIVTVILYDINNIEVVPDTATYRIVDLKSGTVIRDTTAITPDFQMQIILDANDNRIINKQASEEMRRITIETTYNGKPARNGIYDYLVQNIGL